MKMNKKELTDMWRKACEHDGIDPDADSVVFSKNNPWEERYILAMTEYLTARKMTTWRIEFTESELAEIYYALQSKRDNPALMQGDKRWQKELSAIMQKILDSGATI
jgi:hypothetical protein